MGVISLNSSRTLLLFCVTLGLLSAIIQVLSILSWDGVNQEFVAIIHSPGIHVAYICITAFVAAFNVMVLFSLRGIEDAYYMDSSHLAESEF